jgi:oligopeptide/dipeptide ABC transporter ATP-binding protein
MMSQTNDESIVQFKGVSKYFKDKKGGIMTAVDSVDVAVGRDRVLALVGESGSGKTTLGRISVGLIDASKGEVLFDGRDIRKYKKDDLWKRAQYLHQDPYSALDPYLTIGEVLERPLRFLSKVSDRDQRKERVSTMMQAIGLASMQPSTKVARLSGGEKQRVLLARSFIMTPDFVAADEPTTMVDFIHRNEILALLRNLRKDLGTSMLLITHDISVASFLADHVAIMFRGSIVEYGPRSEVLERPLHPYTQTLLSLTPDKLASGEVRVADLLQKKRDVALVPREKGCKYESRCPYAFSTCRGAHPPLELVSGEHSVACYLDHESPLSGPKAF